MKSKELLSDLIAIKSYSGAEGELATYVKHYFEGRGVGVYLDAVGNVIAKLDGVDGTRAFIFNSHMDTVSAGDESLWRYGPWTPTTDGDRLVGLGASDMKSGLAATMLLVEEYLRHKPPVDVWFTCVVREEQDGSGTAAFADWFGDGGGYAQMAAIFAEPTGLVELEYGHRGNLFVLAESSGDSGHASRPEEIKVHAVKQMMEFTRRLETMMLEWADPYQGGVFTPPTVGVLTSIQAGVEVRATGEVAVASPNKFPASCRATFDVRTVPGFHEKAMELITELGRRMDVRVSLAFPEAPSGYTDPGEKIVKVASAVLGKPKLTVSHGSADLGFLTAKGIKAVIFGPGEKDQCHRVNEYCQLEKVDKAVDIYQKVVEAWAR